MYMYNNTLRFTRVQIIIHDIEGQNWFWPNEAYTLPRKTFMV